MRLTVVVPGALLPEPIASDVIGAARAPGLARLVARARVEAPRAATPATLGAAHWGWLWRFFSGRDDAPVTAPYAWRALNETDLQADADDGTLWQADPIHFSVARDHMLAVPLDGGDALDHHETMALAAEAETCAQAAGARLRVLDHYWFVRFDDPWRLQAAPLDAALGASIQHLLPQGDDSARWRRLLTEIQIAWHAHPVNAAREQRGARSVNGLWLHGGGPMHKLPPAALARVACPEPAVRGWALAAGLPPAAVVAEEPAAGPVGASALAYWPGLFAACKADAWHPWLENLAAFDTWLAAQAQRAFAAGAQVELVLCGRTRTRSVLAAPGDRWRLWRDASLAAVLAEPPLESA